MRLCGLSPRWRIFTVVCIFSIVLGVSVNYGSIQGGIVQNEELPQWLVPGAYAEYSMSWDPFNDGHVTVITYDEEMEFQYTRLYEEDGDEFIYRWEIFAVSSEVVNLSVHILATGWMNATFPMTLNRSDYVVSYNGTSLGVARFWLASDHLVPGMVIFSNPFTTISHDRDDVETRYTLQGVQVVLHIWGDIDTPADPFISSIGYDESEALCVRLLGDFCLPIPLEYQVVIVMGDIALVTTNVYLGPDILLPDLSGLVELGGILAGVIVLGVVFGLLRRHQRKQHLRERLA